MARSLEIYGSGQLEQLPQLQKLPRALRSAMRVVAEVLPFRVNNYVVEELIDWNAVPDDPIFRLTFPQPDMLSPAHFQRIAAVLDSNRTTDRPEARAVADAIRRELNPHPEGQLEYNVPLLDGRPVPGVQHKYRETSLIFPSAGQTCHAYCSFCFRWTQFVGMPDLKFATDESMRFRDYLREHREITDVLLTGGDPLVMRTNVLARYIEPLLESDLGHIQTIRLGTKALSYWPYRFLSDDDAGELLGLLERIVASGKHLAIMAHFNHFKELETESVEQAIRRLLSTGAVIRTQSPVVRWINDDAEIWSRMWQRQVRLGCVPYYMFVERDTGAQDYFKLPIARAVEIYRQAVSRGSGLAATARGPVMSALPGKVHVEGVADVGGRKVFVLSLLRGRDPAWCGRPFFAEYDAEASWMTELRPAFGESQFFYQSALNRMLTGPTQLVQANSPADLRRDASARGAVPIDRQGQAAVRASSIRHGIAVTAHPLATEAACAVLRSGGNAIDAAVAAAWTLSVCEPSNSGLGGQTVMLLHLAAQAGARQTDVVIDGHSRAPAAVTRQTVSRKAQKFGFRATTVPTTPLTLEAARQRYGRLPLASLMAAAIEIATDGFVVAPLYRRQLGWRLASLSASPSAAQLLLNRGRPHRIGERFRQPALAATLQRMARLGVDDFYHGDIARRIAEDMSCNDGLMTLEDLASVQPPAERAPVECSYRGRRVLSAPAPAGGGQLLRGLQLLEQLDAGQLAVGQWYELLGEVTYNVYRERECQSSDCYEAPVTEQGMAEQFARSPGDAARLVGPQEPGSDFEEPGETTHLCVSDGDGNVVTLTQSIQSLFGASVACLPCGFLYNNYLLTCPRAGKPHGLSPHCLPRSNAAPTLVLNDDRPAENQDGPLVAMALGGAGSRRMTSALLHTLSGVFDRGLTLGEAVQAPRLHVKLSRRAWLEQDDQTEPLAPQIEKRFSSLQFRCRYSYAMGCVNAIQIDRDAVCGVADPRREGSVRVVSIPTTQAPRDGLPNA